MTGIDQALLLACAAYIVGTATPGPATLLIATASMRDGRRIGLATAFGVLCGSLAWGLLAAGGMATALGVWTPLAQALRIAGGLYLLWLSIKSIRSALSDETGIDAAGRCTDRLGRAFGRGLLVHLTNPKAVLPWLATVAIGTSSSASPHSAFVVVAICWSLGILIFCGYAIVFANPCATALYARSRKKVDALAAAVFGTFGVTLIIGRE